MNEPSRPTALITGASSGIGAALAHTFARNGFDLVLTARRRDRLDALSQELETTYGRRTTVIVADLSDPAAPAAIVSEIDKLSLQIDALVNNAGYPVLGDYQDSPWEEARDQLQVMTIACCELVHRLLPGMVARRRGYILNVSSVAGLVPGGGRPLYGGMKALLVQFTRCLHVDLTGSGVRVSVTCPGFTRTEFKGILAQDGYSRVPGPLLLSAEQVADESFAALMQGRVVFIPGRLYRVLWFITRLLPEPLVMRVLYRLTRRAQSRRS